MRLFMLTAAVLAALVSPVFAQATGQINGVVTDSSGAVVPGATVSAIEQQTGLSRDTVSGANGLYTFPNLRPTTYEIRAVLTGFRTVRRTEISLAANQNLAAYRQAGIAPYSSPVIDPPDQDQANRFFATLDKALARNRARVLVHRESIDDTLGGLIGGYLVKSGLLNDPILALAVIQQILGRALGPEGRALIPEPSAP